MKRSQGIVLQYTFLLTALLLASRTYAQKFRWPEPAEKGAIAKEKYVDMTGAIKGKEYAKAVSPLNWLIKNAPDLNKSLYINGVKIYENLAKKTKGNKKMLYADSVLKIYDKRIAVFNDAPKSMKRKAISAYKLYGSTPSKYPELIEIFEQAIQVTPKTKQSKAVPIGYFDIVVKYQEKTKKYSQNDIVKKFEMAYEALEALSNHPKYGKTIPPLKANLDKMFAKIATIDCKFVQEKWVPKFKNEPENKELAKLIFNFGYKASCDFPEVVQAAELINKDEKSLDVTLYIAKKKKSYKQFAAAFPYYKEAVKMTIDKQQKSDLTKEIGDILSFQKKYTEAREKYREAIKIDPTNRGVYASIGELYYLSFDLCAKKESMLDDRAVFILAYDYFYKAGNQKKMKKAKLQFPTSKDVFEQNKRVGDPITIGCWINEKTKIAKK